MYEIKVQNLSAATARQCAVHVLNSSSPVDINGNGPSTYDVSSLTFAALASAVLSSPRQRTYTAEQLATGTSSFISFPTSLSAYNGWCQHGFAADASSSYEHMHDAWKHANQSQPMSTVMVLFPAVAVDQVYEIRQSLRDVQAERLGL